MSLAAMSGQEARPEPSLDDAEPIFRRITRRIMPLLFVSFSFAFLDRINVGYAELQMKPLLGFSDSQYGLGAGMYFISTILFAVPGVMFVERVGVRRAFLVLMTFWGLASAGNMFVTTPAAFYVCRFVMGVFECAFFPGIVFYLTLWYPGSRRAQVTSYIMLSIQMAGLIGGPMSGAIMSGLDHVNGWRGWQWLFLLEGFPVVVMGVLCYLLLADRPAVARWLKPHEQAVIARAVAIDRAGDPPALPALHKLRLVLSDRLTYALAFLNFATICAAYTFNFWLPTIIKSLGVVDVFSVGLFSFIPYLFASIGVLLIGWLSDRLRERRWIFVACVCAAALSLSSLPMFGASFVLSMVALCIFGFSINAAITVFWAVLATYMPRDRASAGISFVGGLGGIAGFLSPTILGFVRQITGSLAPGFYLFSLFLILAAVIMAVVLPVRAVEVRV